MAGYLLDSNAFLWIKTDTRQVQPDALAELADASNRVHVSIAGLWELAIKAAMGKIEIFDRLIGLDDAALRNALRESGFQLLSIEVSHVLVPARLPLHHRNPFDRMIIAQAQQQNLVVVTRDAIFACYEVRVLQI
jgi:PIN domain nuclease of toxin-antitoxin system